ncbi:hypothetical protein [Pseudomonas lurida]|uniref:Uncharacterized protein n=1 Tax=Pseudomonas lurida TaxID=244566 RepID=A0ABY9FQ04_9PSED|nr:hypothetical protein [Pseudomonas lurida]WLH05407.1 hypothetical protein PSH67_21575 [Pseudomonas lurida]
MLVLVDQASGLAVNPDDISVMRIEKARGQAGLIRVLSITMKGGAQVTLDSTTGINIYDVHSRLLEAK